MIESLKKNPFTDEIFSPAEAPASCPTCGSHKLWQTHGSDVWRCRECHPPPSPAAIANVKINGVVTAWANYGQPVAPAPPIAPPPFAVPSPGSDQPEPPRAPSPVPLEAPGDSHLVSRSVLTGCDVACLRCLSMWYVESVWSDGAVELLCYSCHKPVSGDLHPDAANERREAKLKARSDEDAAIAAG